MNINDAFAIKYNTKQQDSDTSRFDALSKDWLGTLSAEDTARRTGLLASGLDLDRAKFKHESRPSSLLSSQQKTGGTTTKVANGAQPVTNVLSGTSLANMPAFTLDDQKKSPLGFKSGTARVPGKGSGKVDTVPAKLAPGEAVLNKAAAEKMGRNKIAKMNKTGAKQMGLSGPKKPGHYAQGTENVKPAPKPSLIQRISNIVSPYPKSAPVAPTPTQTGPRNVGPAVTGSGGRQFQYSTYGADPDARIRRAMGEE